MMTNTPDPDDVTRMMSTTPDPDDVTRTMPTTTDPDDVTRMMTTPSLSPLYTQEPAPFVTAYVLLVIIVTIFASFLCYYCSLKIKRNRILPDPDIELRPIYKTPNSKTFFDHSIEHSDDDDETSVKMKFNDDDDYDDIPAHSQYFMDDDYDDIPTIIHDNDDDDDDDDDNIVLVHRDPDDDDDIPATVHDNPATVPDDDETPPRSAHELDNDIEMVSDSDREIIFQQRRRDDTASDNDNDNDTETPPRSSHESESDNDTEILSDSDHEIILQHKHKSQLERYGRQTLD